MIARPVEIAGQSATLGGEIVASYSHMLSFMLLRHKATENLLFAGYSCILLSAITEGSMWLLPSGMVEMPDDREHQLPVDSNS